MSEHESLTNNPIEEVTDEDMPALDGSDTVVTDDDVSPEGRYEVDDFSDEWEDDFGDFVFDEEEASAPVNLEELEREVEQQKLQKAMEEVQEEEIEEEVEPVQEITPEQEDIILDDIQEEAPLSEEDEKKAEELEELRSATRDISAELVDVSEIKFEERKTKKKKEGEPKTEEEIKREKKRKEEERKRKRQEENDIFANRYKAKTINAAVAQSDPIIYFYNVALSKDGSVKLFNVFQVLQDRFVGKMIPQLWTAVAEASDRVLELNEANLIEQLGVCKQYPMYQFVISISTRFFTKPAVLEKFLGHINEPIDNLVMAFDCVSLQNLGTAAKTGLAHIKEKGVKILLDNTEKVSMTTLSELDFDFIRIDSRYYELGNFKAEGFLRLLTGFAAEQGVPTIATFCDNEDMAEYMFYMGVDAVQGNAVSRPMRTVPNAIKSMTLLESMKGEE